MTLVFSSVNTFPHLLSQWKVSWVPRRRLRWNAWPDAPPPNGSNTNTGHVAVSRVGFSPQLWDTPTAVYGAPVWQKSGSAIIILSGSMALYSISTSKNDPTLPIQKNMTAGIPNSKPAQKCTTSLYHNHMTLLGPQWR